MSYMGPVIAVTFAIMVVELLLGRYRGIFRKEDWLVIGLPAILNPVVSRSIAGLVIASFVAAVAPQGKGALAHLPLIPSYLVLMLIVEFSFYWMHRWAHEAQRSERMRWLWKLHRTHHAGKYMNVLVTLRMNLFWSWVVPTSWILGFAVYFGQGAAAAMVIPTIYGWNLLTHANFRWDDGVRRHPRFGRAFRAAEHIVVSPGVHHTHHGYGQDGASYRNYAVTFAFLDWVFGTLHIPSGRPWRYGLPGSEPHWLEEIFYPLINKEKGSNPAPSRATAEPVLEKAAQG